jgi:hypothetical protein
VGAAADAEQLVLRLLPGACAGCAATGRCTTESWAGGDEGHCACAAGWAGALCVERTTGR